VFFCDGIELGGFVLFTRVLFVFVAKASVVNVTFPDAVLVAFGNHSDE